MTQLKTDIAADLKKAMSAGDFETAAKVGVRILRTHPKRADIQIMTAVSELQGKNPSAAGPRLIKLFRAVPRNDKLFDAVVQNLRQYSQITNDFSSVESVIEERLNAAPQEYVFAYLLGDTIFQRVIAVSPGKCVDSRLSLAVEVLQRIPESSKFFNDVQKLIANIHLHQETYDIALEVLEKALVREPGNLDLRVFLTSCYAMAGKVEQAVKSSLAVISEQPEYSAQPYVVISFMRPQAMPESSVASLEAILANPRSDGATKYKAYFALAKIAETDGDMQRAFACYEKGHAANRLARPFDMHQELGQMQVLEDTVRKYAFQSDVAFEAKDADAAGPKPIFIVGMPRSGTTLTERILGAHPDVYAAGEVGDFAKAVAEVVGRGTMTEQLMRLDKKAIRKIRLKYLAALNAYAPEKRFVTNKTPANFLRLEMIRRVFPDAPIIHTHRHPLATCLSIYTTPFAVPMRYADDLGQLADYYRAYVSLMKVFFETDQAGKLYDLTYEDLIADPETVAKDYLAHCGLDWRPECLEFYKTDQTAATASMIQVRRPIFKDSLGKWQRFEPYIGPLAELADGSDDNMANAAQKSSRKAVAA